MELEYRKKALKGNDKKEILEIERDVAKKLRAHKERLNDRN